MLKLINLNYGYTDGASRRSILQDCSYTFEDGRFYTILGPSGSGKTTLLSILAGLDSAESGELWYNGTPITSAQLYHYRRNQIGIVFQQYNLINYLTGIENVELAMTETDNAVPKNRREIAYALLEKVGIVQSKANRPISKLSGGEQQRIAIARALAANADLIFAHRKSRYRNRTGNHSDLQAAGRRIRQDRYRRDALRNSFAVQRRTGASGRRTAAPNES